MKGLSVGMPLHMSHPSASLLQAKSPETLTAGRDIGVLLSGSIAAAVTKNLPVTLPQRWGPKQKAETMHRR